MLHINANQKRAFWVPVSVILIFSGLILLPFPWEDWTDGATANLLHKMRGPQPLDEKIILVHIGREDIRTLGGWPITRDYYGYMTHALSNLGADVVGFNLLFDAGDPRFPEYDRILADFFQSAGNICLPFSFFDLQKQGKSEALLQGHQIIDTFSLLKQSVAGLGYSNLGNTPVVSRVPIVATYADSSIFSFGVSLAARYLGQNSKVSFNNGSISIDSDTRQIAFPVDDRGRIWLNHFGRPEHVQSVGFVDLLQSFSSTPDSLDVAGKIVIVDVIAPGIPALFTTPFTSQQPSSLVHATVASNILNQNFLRLVPAWAQLLTLAIAVGATALPRGQAFRWFILVIVLLLLTSFLMFQANYVFSLFYLLPAVVSSRAGIAILKAKEKRMADLSHRKVLQQEIVRKEDELRTASNQLGSLQDRLLNESVTSEQLKESVARRTQAVAQLEKKLRDLKRYSDESPVEAPQEFTEIICAANSPMAGVLQMVTKVAPDDIPVLITGETGTGKELIAKAIHQRSKRCQGPFVAVNCGALPETLLESELFGHEKGSFTNAMSQRKGRFELANGGTIFLDEISETSQAFQSRLLRVLQEGTFERLGGEQTLHADVRVIAATNRDLQQTVKENQFRSDLFYRLNGFPIQLPRLRERRQDTPLLAEHFLKQHDYAPVSGFSDRAMQMLSTYFWPGNVRELENIVRRSAILAQSENRTLIQIGDLPPEITEGNPEPFTETDYQSFEDQILASLRKLKFSRSSISETARALGNKDRGTITEYFRGICFQYLVEEEYDIQRAAGAIAGSDTPEIIERVTAKLEGYLDNLQALPESVNLETSSIQELPSQFKGLPKKYHQYLLRVAKHFN